MARLGTTVVALVGRIGYRVTLTRDDSGNVTFAMIGSGFVPAFDPSRATYMTDRAVRHLSAQHGIGTADGETFSATALRKAAPAKGLDRIYTFAEIQKHKHQGPALKANRDALIATYKASKAS